MMLKTRSRTTDLSWPDWEMTRQGYGGLSWKHLMQANTHYLVHATYSRTKRGRLSVKTTRPPAGHLLGANEKVMVIMRATAQNHRLQ